MHLSAILGMYEFIKKYAKPRDKILEVGSEGSNHYRQLPHILELKPNYVGLDIKKGFNVDIAVEDPYSWKELSDNEFDIVISGSTLEHIEFFWVVFKEMARVLKPGGYMCVIVPRKWKNHFYPVDCWRFLPDGMRALGKWANLKCIVTTEVYGGYYVKSKETMMDCIGVFQK